MGRSVIKLCMRRSGMTSLLGRMGSRSVRRRARLWPWTGLVCRVVSRGIILCACSNQPASTTNLPKSASRTQTGREKTSSTCRGSFLTPWQPQSSIIGRLRRMCSRCSSWTKRWLLRKKFYRLRWIGSSRWWVMCTSQLLSKTRVSRKKTLIKSGNWELPSSRTGSRGWVGGVTAFRGARKRVKWRCVGAGTQSAVTILRWNRRWKDMISSSKQSVASSQVTLNKWQEWRKTYMKQSRLLKRCR